MRKTLQIVVVGNTLDNAGNNTLAFQCSGWCLWSRS